MAGITHLKEFQKEALQGLVDATVDNRQETVFDTFLPNRNTFNNNFVYDIVKNTPHVAGLIAYGAETPVADRDAVARLHGELAKMGLKYIVTEEELLAIHHARFDAERQQVIDELVAKAVDLVNAILLRSYIMKAEALAKGQLIYDANGVKATVDFGIPSEHKIAYDPANDFEDGSVDVIGKLIEWVQIYEDNNAGQAPSEILMSRKVQNALLSHSSIIALTGNPNAPSRVSEQFLNDIFRQYGLPPVRIVTRLNVTTRNVYTGQDEVVNVFPENRVVMLGEGIGNFLYGVTVENDFQPGIAVRAYDEDEPIRSIIKAVATGFPAIAKPSLILHADVLASQ